MSDWNKPVRLHELSRGPVRLDLEAPAEARTKIAAELGLESLPSLKAQVTVKPWMDGAEITGRLRATVEQICSVSLDAFEQPVDGEIEVRVVPEGSPHALAEEASELELDADAPDPPDVLDGDSIDVAAYVVEHLALTIDPFPRKPGAEFDYTPPVAEESPFAVLKKLKDPEE